MHRGICLLAITGAVGCGASEDPSGPGGSTTTSTGAATSGTTGPGGGGGGGGGGTGAGGAGGGTPFCGQAILADDFEDGDFVDTLTHEDGAGAVAVVSVADGADVYGGDKCLRGNFRIGYTDPLTGLAAPERYSGLDIDLGEVERFYVSLRYRIDPDAQWVMDDGNDTGLGYKFFYLMGTPWNNTTNWVLAQLWSNEHWWFGDNQPNDNTGYQEAVDADPAQGELGAWHHIEITAELNSAPGVGDGRFRLRIDGTVVIERDDVPFQTSTAQKFGTLGGVPHMYGGCCGPKFPFGWQIDDLEVWELPDGCEAP
jgi:hypothetical protein